MKRPSLNDVQNYVEGNISYALRESLPPHITEQVALREFLCAPCLENNKCLICKCPTPKMFYSPNKVDSLKKWGKFMDQDQWEALKNNINEYHEYITNELSGVQPPVLEGTP